jgi:hypothetical protein
MVWNSLSVATRRKRERFFRDVCNSTGAEPFVRVTRATIVTAPDRRANTPFDARHFLDAMRGIFRWALDAGLVTSDPTVGVRNPIAPKSEGFIQSGGSALHGSGSTAVARLFQGVSPKNCALPVCRVRAHWRDVKPIQHSVTLLGPRNSWLW